MTLQYEVPKFTSRVLLSQALDISALLDLTECDPVVREARVACRLGYSVVQTRRACRTALGEPVISFVRRMKLERAAGQLSCEPESVSDIGLAAGFCSPASFSKAFHDHFGCSPSDFRLLNSNSDCLMPGYLLSKEPASELPKRVRFRTGVDRQVSFLYDGPLYLARVLPGCQLDWRLP